MSKNAQLALEAALERIIAGVPKRIPATRKLSLRAVEEEANLGNGTGYYYPEFVEKVKLKKADSFTESSSTPEINTQRLREKAKQESRIKEKYKRENQKLKALVASMAAEQHQFNDALRKALLTIENLELKIEDQKEEIIELKRSKISKI